jgi:hypothetical protein
MDHDVIVLGIPIPSDDPLFLATLALHVPAGLLCVVAGLIAMLRTKGPGPQPRTGSLYYWSLLVVFATATVLSIMRWADNYHLFYLGFRALIVCRRLLSEKTDVEARRFPAE